jgi:nitrogen regulatory protein PII
MKLLLAIIQPTKLHAVREALYRAGVERMTVCDAQGYGRQRGQTATYRGIEYKVNMLRKISLEIWVNDDFVERTIETLQRVARTGSNGTIGDGKVFILPTEQAIAIESNTRGPGAV